MLRVVVRIQHIESDSEWVKQVYVHLSGDDAQEPMDSVG